MAGYNPFAVGDSPVDVRTIRVDDPVRDRSFDVELWEPSGVSGPLVVYSHHSGGDRRSASYLCTHLAGHGYRVAAMDHVIPEFAETDRVEALIAGRVPDVRLLLDQLAGSPEPVGLAGHSFGGWTALATPEHDPRVDAVVALAPGGSRNPMPGILPLSLTFARSHPVPTLFLAAADDVEIPLDRVRELFDRAPQPRRMAVLRRADHQHFADDVEAQHEALRAMTLPGDAAWIPAAMRPIGELCTGEQAHTFARGLSLAHFDAELRDDRDARRFLDDGLDDHLARHAIDAYAVKN